MREGWHKFLVAGVIGLTLAIGITSAGNLWRDLGRPFGGFVAGRNVALNSWHLDAATPAWWPGITQATLSTQDTLVALDGYPYSASQGAIYADAYSRGKSFITLTVARDGAAFEKQIPVVPFTVANFIDVKVPELITGLVFWLLAVIVYRAGSTNSVNLVFAAACSLVAAHRWLAPHSLFLDVEFIPKILDLALVLIAPFIVALTIHFALLFPRPSRFQSPYFLVGLYAITTVVAILYMISRLLWWQTGSSRLVSILDSTGYQGSLLALGAALAFVLARFVWLLLRERSSRRLQRQLLVILLGFSCALPIIVLMIVDGLSQRSVHYFLSGLDLRYLLLAVPLAFAFVILRYQTFRSANPLFLSVFILASSALLASAGAWIIQKTEVQAGISHTVPPFIPLLGVTMAASIFWSIQGSWQGAFGRLLHWQTRSYEAVRQFGQRVAGQINLATLPDTIAAALVTELELERAAVWLWDEEEGVFALVGQEGQWTGQRPDTLPVHGEPLNRLRSPIRLHVEEPSHAGWLEPLRRLQSIEIVVPLIVLEKPLGLLALGKRWDEEIFDERDLELIEIIAQQAALFLLAALQVDELRQIPHRVAEAQERERNRIAQELHDTIQQFLGRLPFYLEVSRNEIPIAPEKADEILARCLADVEAAAQTVRQIRNNLTPGQLERGLVQPLKELVERFKFRTGIGTHLELSLDVEPLVSLQTRHALYRIVQQALDNVASHARATLVRVSLAQSERGVRFVIVDNGCGSSAEQRVQARAQGSFGLQSMEARASALAGEIHFSSTPGAGTEIRGWLPI